MPAAAATRIFGTPSMTWAIATERARVRTKPARDACLRPAAPLPMSPPRPSVHVPLPRMGWSRGLAGPLARYAEQVQNWVMTVEVQWSELARDAKGVARKVDDSGEVRVRRRDGVTLVLRREDLSEELGSGLVVAARALRKALTQLAPNQAATVLVDEFPWVEVLPAGDQAEFVAEFVRAAQAAAELGRPELLARVINEWKNTALVYTSPDMLAAATTPVDSDFGPVPSPEAV